MTIIVTKTRIIIDVVGSYFYEKIMTKNGSFVLGGPEAHLHDILCAINYVNSRGRSEDGELFGDFSVYSEWSGTSNAEVYTFFSYTCVCEPFAS